jgi:hypothetical protein
MLGSCLLRGNGVAATAFSLSLQASTTLPSRLWTCHVTMNLARRTVGVPTQSQLDAGSAHSEGSQSSAEGESTSSGALPLCGSEADLSQEWATLEGMRTLLGCLDPEGFCLGPTCVFMEHAMLDVLERLRRVHRAAAARRVQRALRSRRTVTKGGQG